MSTKLNLYMILKRNKTIHVSSRIEPVKLKLVWSSQSHFPHTLVDREASTFPTFFDLRIKPKLLEKHQSQLGKLDTIQPFSPHQPVKIRDIEMT